MKIALFYTVLIFMISCTDNEPKEFFNVQDTAQFKQWVVDTLSAIYANQNVGYLRELELSDDSLYLDIKSYYNLPISSDYKGGNEDLLYALDLLNRNSLLPESHFILEFEIHRFYTPSFIPRLTYDFDSEVSKFNVEYPDSIIHFSFMKGNLIDRNRRLKSP